MNDREVRLRDRRRRLGGLRARQPAQRRPRHHRCWCSRPGARTSDRPVHPHAGGAAIPIGNRFYDWQYESEPEPYMNGRRIYHARGKVLGGSSSINGMIFQRGNPLDYERWAADPGMETWDYAHCLPYFKRMETCLAGADEWRGGDGPLVLERGPATNPLFGAFFEAVQQAGYPLTDDVNGYRQEGFARFDRNVYRGPPAQRRARLPAPGDEAGRTSTSRRLRDGHQGPLRGQARVTGVDYLPRGRAPIGSTRARSSSAAAPSTRPSCCSCPASATRHLEPLGIDVVADLPGVGENLQDHLEVYIQYASKQPVSIAPRAQALAQPAADRGRVAVPPPRPRRDQPLRGRRLRPQQRRRRLPEPDVPLPADRDPLRRLGADRARLPGAHRPDVLRLPGLGEDHLDRPARAPRRCGSTTCRPTRTGGSGSRRSGSPGTS